MKLVEAIKIIEEQEKRQHMAVKDMQKAVVVVRRSLVGEKKDIENTEQKIVPVKTYLLRDDLKALKEKTKESSVMGAISKAVDYYLKYGEEE